MHSLMDVITRLYRKSTCLSCGLSLFFIFYLSPLHATSNKNPECNHFKVLTLNIRMGFGQEELGGNVFKLKDTLKANIPPIINAIKSSNADVVFLQEVHGETQAEDLANKLNMQYHYIPHGTHSYGAWWGVALLTKYAITDNEVHQLTTGYRNTRSASISKLEINDKNILAVNVHLDKDVKSVKPLLKLLDLLKLSNLPIILAGDFNFLQNDKRHALLIEFFDDSNLITTNPEAETVKRIGTYCRKCLSSARSAPKRIDYIFTKNNSLKVLETGLLDKSFWGASDHIGYWATLVHQNCKL